MRPLRHPNFFDGLFVVANCLAIPCLYSVCSWLRCRHRILARVEWGFVVEVPPIPRCSDKDVSDFPCSLTTLLHVCPILGPRQDLAPCLGGASVLPLRTSQQRLPRYVSFRGSIIELSCWLSTLRAAVSLPATQDSLPVVASLAGWNWLPIESFRAVLALAAPAPGLRMAREVTRLKLDRISLGSG